MIELENRQKEFLKEYATFLKIPKIIKSIENHVYKIAIQSMTIPTQVAVSKIMMLNNAKDKFLKEYFEFEKFLNKFDDIELEILDYLKSNYSVTDIAKEMNVSWRTVFRKISKMNKKYLEWKNGKI